MNLTRVLVLTFFLVKAVAAAEKIVPEGVTQLSQSDETYSVALFHYFNRDYQQALKELSHINQADFSNQQKTTHQNFKHILLVSNGESFNSSLFSDERDNAVMQAVLLAVERHIKLEEWTQAAQLFKSLPDDMPSSLIAQHAYLMGYLALQRKNNNNVSKSEHLLDKQSQEFALLLQHKGVMPLENPPKSNDTINQLLMIDNVAYLDIKNSGLLAQGYRYLAKDDPRNAVRAFKHITFNSLDNNAASLGFGLALNQLESFDRAQQLFKRVLSSGDPGGLYFEASLGNAYALEQLGNDKEAYQQLSKALKLATERVANLPALEAHWIKQQQCIITLLDNVRLHTCDLQGEELNEQFLSLLSTQAFIDITKQNNTLTSLAMDYAQKRQTIDSFIYLLSHQVSLIQQLLNNSKIQALEDEIADTTAQRVVIVRDVDQAEAESNGQFFLSSHYLALQKRIDEVFKRMVFLKRAGQMNMASERRVTLMQRIVWWHSFSNFTQHVSKTRVQIKALDNQLKNNTYAYQVLQDYLSKLPIMAAQLTEIERISREIKIQEQHLPLIRKEIYVQINKQFRQFSIYQKQSLEAFILNAELARVRIADASFNRLQNLEEGMN